MSETITVIIAAAGQSTRMAGEDKIMADLGGVPVLARSVETFQDSALVDEIVVVVHPNSVEAVKALAKTRDWHKVKAIVPGGAHRQDSVQRALEQASAAAWILVHDGARPLMPPELISRGLKAARETGAAAAAVPLKDTVKLVGPDDVVVGTPPRENLRLIQTPQVFAGDLLRRAYAASTPDASVTDDAALVERIGGRVKLFTGDYVNIKITTPQDRDEAARLLKSDVT